MFNTAIPETGVMRVYLNKDFRLFCVQRFQKLFSTFLPSAIFHCSLCYQSRMLQTFGLATKRKENCGLQSENSFYI